MRRLSVLAATIIITTVLLLSGCGPKPSGAKNTEIIDAKTALELVRNGALLVDAQDFLRYNRAHAAGAINISRADIVLNVPIPGLVAPASQIEEVMSSRGVGPETMVVTYDTNQNMDAARLWWTLKYYGHDLVKVVSGGLDALEAAGAEIVSGNEEAPPTVFRASAPKSAMIARMSDVRAQVDDPDANAVLIDVRTTEEYAEGTIPGSILIDFAGNNFPDGTFRPIQHIRIRYLEEGIDYDDRIIVYCRTSIRAAQTYLALYNAGYRDIALYDGAWLEWTSVEENPIQLLDEAAVEAFASDNS